MHQGYSYSSILIYYQDYIIVKLQFWKYNIDRFKNLQDDQSESSGTTGNGAEKFGGDQKFYLDRLV